MLTIDPIYLPAEPKKISIDKIVEFLNDTGTKRIDFSSIHSDCLTQYKDGWKINLPFKDTIEPILKYKMGENIGTLYKHKNSNSEVNGVWRAISNEDYPSWEEFIEKYKNIIFLRDNLDLSLALSMNINNQEERTRIGELEYQAKYNNNQEAEKELIYICTEWLKELPFYNNSKYICAVPGSNLGTNNLPQRIAELLAKELNLVNISGAVSWDSKEKFMKEAKSTDERIEILENSGLTIKLPEELKGKDIILIDDLYMSGATMQYLGMKLKERQFDVRKRQMKLSHQPH